MSRKTVYMETLGCPKNRVDSERTIFALNRAGAELVTDETCADILIVNTCGFVSDAKEESIDRILALAEEKKARKNVKLAVMGCLSERHRDEIKELIPEIDFLYGVDELETIVKEVGGGATETYPDPDKLSRIITTSPYWAYLKISEGCSNTCSFCSIPSIRGPYKSRAIKDIVAEAEQLALQGVKELILVAQDSSLYGADIRESDGLLQLLKKLGKIDGLAWIRVMYLYPALVTDRLLNVFATEEKVAPYFDIPFQHISNAVLKRMKRPETGSLIRSLVKRIRSQMPNSAIRSSFIVGFPGETEEDFDELLAFLKDVKLDHVGAFIYSPEEGTTAFLLPDRVDGAVAEDRLERLMDAQRKISEENLKKKTGLTLDVLVDGIDPDENLLTGRIKTQAPEVDGVVILDAVDAVPGSIIPVRITGVTDYDLIGEAL